MSEEIITNCLCGKCEGGQATKKDIRREGNKCWGCQKQKIILFTDWTGWYYCFKCWKRDYKWGRCHGLLQALKDLKLQFKW